HWSLSSGGASEGCIPSSIDNAVFNSASFTGEGQVVTLDLPNINVNNMTWTGVTNTPTLRSTIGGAGQFVNVYGSLTLVPQMILSLPLTKWAFKASATGKTIASGGHALYNLDFNTAGGGWTLTDDLTVTNFLTFYQGT